MITNWYDIPAANQMVLLTALQFLGIKEIKGARHNQTILKFWELIEIEWGVNDEFAWCAAAHNAILKLSNCHYFKTGLARKGLDLPNIIGFENAIVGDTVILSRTDNPKYGHEGIFIRYEGNKVVLMGGNQSDTYRASYYPKSRIVGIRRPKFLNTEI